MAPDRAHKRRRLSPPEENQSMPGFARWNLEQDYEQRPRKSKKKDESSRLPIKKDGRIERLSISEPNIPSDDDSVLASDEEVDSAVADLKSSSAVEKPKLSQREEVRQAKEDLAKMAGNISENPEEHIGLLGSMAQLEESDNVMVKKLALGAQSAVFKDIIPGYRIRPLSKEDMQSKVSKEVRNVRNFEQGLLGAYKSYVQRLAELSKDAENDLVEVALTCACALLESVPHFNCRNDLIAILVRKLSGRTANANFDKARESLELLFREDDEGHASLEAVGQITKMMKGKNYNNHEGVLNMFLHLRLLSEFAHKGSTNSVDKSDEASDGKGARNTKSKREFRTKRERKVMRERKEVEKEMKEADAAVGYEERDKNQSETLKLVFVAYFRILKARTPHLMGAVLEGLAKYAHLINQDFFGDILEALKDLIQDAETSLEISEEDDQVNIGDSARRNTTRETLLCMITAFALLQGQLDVVKSANTLHLDLTFFITRLYGSLLLLSQDPDIELSVKTAHLADPNGLHVPTAKDAKVNVATTAVLLLRSLHAVLLPPTATKQVPPVRVAAFFKQLLTASIHMPAKSAEAILALLQQASKVHGPRIAALWHTEDRNGDGVFDALTGKAESSNAFASTVWEGEVLRLHFDPKIREGVRSIEKTIAGCR